MTPATMFAILNIGCLPYAFLDTALIRQFLMSGPGPHKLCYLAYTLC